MDLQLPITLIDTAVSMRDLSKYKALREQAAALSAGNDVKLNDKDRYSSRWKHRYISPRLLPMRRVCTC